MIEIELKFYPVNKNDVRRRLEKAGFKCAVPEFMMTRVTLDPPVAKTGWARVRTEHNRITMSIKHMKSESLSGMQEVELTIDSFETGVEFLKAAGFSKKAFQETLREIWKRDGVEATIDTWPGLEPLIEIEADSEEQVLKAVADLGFNKDEAMFGSSDIVYEKVFGVPREEVCLWPEITFKNPPKK